MKISQPTENPAVVSSNAAPVSAKNAPSASVQARSSAAKSPQSAGVAVTVSTLTRSLEVSNAGEMPDVDSQKVEAVRTAIADGTYVVNPGVIADRLLSNAQEMLQGSRV